MRRSFSSALTLILAVAASFAAFAPAWAAERVKLIDDWKFRRGDADEPQWRFSWRNLEPYALATRDQLVAPGKRAKVAATPGFNARAIRPDYDDSGWETVNLPHDAAIYQDFSYANEPTQALLPTTEPVWYRKSFELAKEDEGKSIFLDFDGAMSRSSVWVNGSYVGGWAYGYTSFRVDATPFVKFGAANTVVVRCGNPPQTSRWYSGNGLYRNVWLVKAAPVRVARWGVFVQTPEVAADRAVARIAVELERAVDESQKDSQVDARAIVRLYRRDANGAKVGEPFAETLESAATLKPGESARLELPDVVVDNPPVWSLETPNTCMAETTVMVDGKVVDVDETPFGFRTIRYDANEGFFLNGEHVVIRGFCVHHDLGALGAAYNEQAERRRFETLKSIGCNAIRLSHNPSAPETVDLLARMGFLVQAETFDQWQTAQKGGWRCAGYYDLFDNWSEADTRSLVRRDRNCPAIIMWSIGNEIPELSDQPAFVRLATRLVQFVHEEDPTRPATSANNMPSAGYGEIPKVLDIFGYNYYGRAAYDKFHELNPDVPVFGSEVVCTGSTRGWYVFPVLESSQKLVDGITDFRQTSYGWFAFGFNPEKPNASWACPPDYEFANQDRHPYACGGFAWTGIDYLGAPFTVDELSRTMRYTLPEIEARAKKEKEEHGAALCPMRNCETGVFDTALFPKDLAFLYKSRWLPDVKTTHILPHWNFPDRVGEVTPVYVYTSGDSAELFLNGRSLGRKSKGEFEYRLRWDDVVYEPGELRAVSYKNGEKWDEAVVATTGAPAALRLTVDRESLVADGRDLAFATLEVLDDQGRVVPDAEVDVSFAVEGAATILATDSGNACDLVSYRSADRRTFAGLALAILQSKRAEQGAVRLTATAEGLESASVELVVK